MMKHSNSNNVLPLCQSIRSPRTDEAEELTKRYNRKRQAQMMLFALVLTASAASVIGKTTTVVKPEYALRRSKLMAEEEPNVFTPRFVSDAMENSQSSLSSPSSLKNAAAA